MAEQSADLAALVHSLWDCGLVSGHAEAADRASALRASLAAAGYEIVKAPRTQTRSLYVDRCSHCGEWLEGDE